MEDGNVLERNLKKERMTQEELAAEARIQQIESLDKVKWAVLESGGQISFIPKSGHSSAAFQALLRRRSSNSPREAMLCSAP